MRIAIDFDGVLTDGKVYLTPSGEKFFSVHSRDNWAIAYLIAEGNEVDIVSANHSPIVKKYAKDRKCGYVFSREKDLEYDVCIVDSIQDALLIKKAKKVFYPKDNALDKDSLNCLLVNGGQGVIDYFVRNKYELLRSS